MAARVPTHALRPGSRVRVARVLGGWHPARHRRGSVLGVVVSVQGTHSRGRAGRVYRVTVQVETDGGAMSAYCLDCGARTERASDGTLVIRHDKDCPNNRRIVKPPAVVVSCQAGVTWMTEGGLDDV